MRRGRTERAKKYLKQIEKLDALIESKLAEVEMWRSVAFSVTAPIGGERVQSSGNQQKMANAIVNYLYLDDDENGIKQLKAERQKIISVIESLNVTEYKLLHKVYVLGYSLADAAATEGKGYTWATTVHGRALQNVERTLRDKDYGE